MKAIRYRLGARILRFILVGIWILAFVLPYAETCCHEDAVDPADPWKVIYLYEDYDSAVFIAPLFAACLFMLDFRLGWIWYVTRIISSLVAGFYFMILFMSLGMPMQDFVPAEGALVLGMIPILLVVLYWVEFKIWQMNKVSANERAL
jgi:hypothetical protein